MKKRQLPIFARVILAGLTCLMFAQCGKSKSQKVNFTIVPKSPIVITGDGSNNGTTITAPWFRFSLHVTNNADDNVVIVGLSLKITAMSFGDGTLSSTGSFTPTSFNYSSADGTTTCTYTNFNVIPAGYDGDFTMNKDASSIGSCATNVIPVFYQGSAPKPLDGTTVTSYRYRVELTPQGWFGDLNDQRDRFSRTVTFYTQ